MLLRTQNIVVDDCEGAPEPKRPKVENSNATWLSDSQLTAGTTITTMLNAPIDNNTVDQLSNVAISPVPAPKRPRLLTRLDSAQAVGEYIKDDSTANSSSHH